MAPEFHVVRCFSCEIFQGHQVKKSTTRWRCKVCREKQSLLKEYGRGSGADCRRHVQQLNAMRGAVMEEDVALPWKPDDDSEAVATVTQTHVSSWSKYLNKSEETEPEGAEPEDYGTMIDRKRKRRDSPEQSQICRNPDGPSTSRTRSSPPGSRSVQSCDPEVSGACGPPRGDIITGSQAPLPVSSLFETNDDFSFDEFLTV